jgi:1-acyl-sn-glycerol-3-phosphate acyltransferase
LESAPGLETGRLPSEPAPPPLRRGAAHIALRSGVALTPAVFRYEPPAFTRGQSWYDAPAERFRVDVRVLDDISPEGVERSGISSSVAARSLTAELRERF